MQKEGETRKSPVEIEGSNYTIDMDYVVMALGSKTEINVVKNLGLELTQEKYVKIMIRNKHLTRKYLQVEI